MMQFDTHKMFKRLQDAGIEDKAADAVISVVQESRQFDLDNLATKQDIFDVKQEISKVEIKITDVKSDIKIIYEKLDNMQSSINEIKGYGKYIIMSVIIPVAFKVLELYFPTLFTR